MIEYIYDVIRATANEPIIVGVEIVDTDGENITSGCSLVLFDSDMKEIGSYEGVYEENWIFTLPAQSAGRYFYTVMLEGNSLCFAKPIYVMEA